MNTVPENNIGNDQIVGTAGPSTGYTEELLRNAEKVAADAEVITSQGILQRIENETDEKEKGKNRAKNNSKRTKKTNKAKRKCNSSSSRFKERIKDPVLMDFAGLIF